MDANTFAKFLATATDADLRDVARTPGVVGAAGLAAVKAEQARRRAAKRAARKAA